MTTLDRSLQTDPHSSMDPVAIRGSIHITTGTRETPPLARTFTRLQRVGLEALSHFARERGHELVQFEAIWQAMDRVAPFVMVRSLCNLGFLRDGQQAATADDVAIQTCSPTRYRPLIAQWLRVLEHERFVGSVDETPDRYKGTAIDRSRIAWELERAAQALDVSTHYPGFIEYFKTCVLRQTELLRGQINPQKLLFPGGNSRIVDGVYRDNPAAAMQNTALATVVGAVRHSLKRPLRILEVGAGTGATTAAVAAHVGVGFDGYCFTDISRFFLRRAARQFSHDNRVSYEVFDIDREPEAQGIPTESFDVVIAANALHTAKDVNRTLQYLNNAVTPGGFLVAIETTRNTALQMITFGHFEGVCHYEDQRRIFNLPFLSVEEWVDALRRAGFTEAGTVPSSVGPQGWQQTVLLAGKAPKHA